MRVYPLMAGARIGDLLFQRASGRDAMASQDANETLFGECFAT